MTHLRSTHPPGQVAESLSCLVATNAHWLCAHVAERLPRAPCTLEAKSLPVLNVGDHAKLVLCLSGGAVRACATQRRDTAREAPQPERRDAWDYPWANRCHTQSGIGRRDWIPRFRESPSVISSANVGHLVRRLVRGVQRIGQVLHVLNRLVGQPERLAHPRAQGLDGLEHRVSSLARARAPGLLPTPFVPAAAPSRSPPAVPPLLPSPRHRRHS